MTDKEMLEFIPANLRDANYIYFDGNAFQPLSEKGFDSTYDMLSRTVDGYIEDIPYGANVLPKGIHAIANEEAKFRNDLLLTGYRATKSFDNPHENCYYDVFDYIKGNIVFTRVDANGDTKPLTVADKYQIINFIDMIGDKIALCYIDQYY